MHPLARRCCGRPHDASLSALRAAAAARWTGRNSLNQRPLLPLRLARSSSYYSGNTPTRTPPSVLQSTLAGTPPNSQTEPYEAKAVVVGGGPAGMSAVANLLEAIPDGKIVWIDQTFQGGNTRLYNESHSFSTPDEFLRFARHNIAFRQICDTARAPNPIQALTALGPHRPCKLRYAVDTLAMLSNGLVRHERVEAIRGTASATARDPETLKWTVKVEPPRGPGYDRLAVADYRAPLVVLCTGSEPRVALPMLTPELPLPRASTASVPRNAALGLGLDQRMLTRRLRMWSEAWAAQLPAGDRTPPTVAVIGDGHSAMLTLRNLVSAGLSMPGGLRVRWFTRNANLKYTMAEPKEDQEQEEWWEADEENWRQVNDQLQDTEHRKLRSEPDGKLVDTQPRRVLNEMDGLRGPIAGWARSQIEGDRILTSKAGRIIQRFILPTTPPPANPHSERQRQAYEEKRQEAERRFIVANLANALRVFQCTGFDPVPLPDVRPALAPLEGMAPGVRRQLAVNDWTGSFYPAGGDPAVSIGLFGAGSAFPESVAVAHGPPQPAVNMLSFGKFVRRMAPLWVEAARAGQMSGQEIKMMTQEQWSRRRTEMTLRMKTEPRSFEK